MKWIGVILGLISVTWGYAQLAVPQNVRDTAIGQDGFTIRWSAVVGATGYDVEVKEAVQSIVIDEDFEDLTSINGVLQFPEGWLKQGDGTKPYEYTSNPTGEICFAILFGVDDFIRLPQTANPLGLRFFVKVPSSSATVTLRVQCSTDGNDWNNDDVLILQANGNNSGDITDRFREYEWIISDGPSTVNYVRFYKARAPQQSA
jgi:hypothetical protein